MRSRILASWLSFCFFVGLCGDLTPTLAQKPPPPAQANPQAPILTMPMPMGMQRGNALDLLITGSNLASPTGLYTGFPAQSTISALDKNGQDNSKLRVHLDVAATVPLGYYPLRLATTRGISNLRLFCIDELPQMLSTGNNHKFETSQTLPVPCVIVSRTEAEASDYFKISVAAGQRLSFDVLGRRLGGPIDPQMSIYSAKTRRELAHDNDAPGCQGDPRLTYLFKETGDYIIEVKDVLNRGGLDYVYRLRIGDFPLATVPIPMAARRGTKTTIHFAGPQLEGVKPVEVTVPADPNVRVVWVAPQGPSGLHGWPVALAVTDVDEVLEQEPNNEPSQANRLNVPCGVTGRFQNADDTDCYVFAAKKGQKLTIEAKTLELNSPTLVYLVVKNAKTRADVVRSNPQSPPPADQRVEFTAAEEGDFLLEAQHLNYAGGPSEAYHLAIEPALPGFDVSLAMDRYDLAAQSFVPLPLTINRRGYTGPIEVSLAAPRPPAATRGRRRGLIAPASALTGATTVKADQSTGMLLVAATGALPPGAYNRAILARATIDGKEVVQPVSVKVPVGISLSGLPFPPPDLNQEVAFAVKEKAPFSLAFRLEPADAVPGTAVQVIVELTRASGFAEEVGFAPPAGLPANVTIPKLANIPKDKNEQRFALDVNAKTAPGEYQTILTAKTKVKDKEYSTNAAFTLRVNKKASP